MSEERAVWSAAYINDLPDSAFLYVEPGGTKDSEGKTVPRSLRHFPYKDASGKVDMPHLDNALARIPQSDLPQSVKDSCTAKARRIKGESMPRDDWRPVHENLYREMEGYEFRDADEDGPPMLSGHFSVFDQWTTIHSVYEGQFRERIAQGAWTKTLKENRDRIRMLFNHGKDILGNQVIAVPTELREDGYGGYYESEVLDGVPQLIVSGLRRKQYGASMRFRVTREEVERHPKESDGNPEGLPERTVREAELMEFGPVTFAAYPTATATLRSLTDDYVRSFSAPEAPSTPDAGDEPHLEPERREPVVVVPAIVPVVRRFRSDEDWFAYIHKEFR